jgi:hypothetical protein
VRRAPSTPGWTPLQRWQWEANNTTGEANFPECHTLPRVSKIGHSGKPIFPECCTQGRNALGEDDLPRVPKRAWHSGNTGKLHLTATLDGAVQKKLKNLFPRAGSQHSGGRRQRQWEAMEERDVWGRGRRARQGDYRGTRWAINTHAARSDSRSDARAGKSKISPSALKRHLNNNSLWSTKRHLKRVI